MVIMYFTALKSLYFTVLHTQLAARCTVHNEILQSQLHCHYVFCCTQKSTRCYIYCKQWLLADFGTIKFSKDSYIVIVCFAVLKSLLIARFTVNTDYDADFWKLGTLL